MVLRLVADVADDVQVGIRLELRTPTTDTH